ncbi:MAG TPA: AmmeMemoRadiSam system protein A [Ilumatobacter sp.]
MARSRSAEGTVARLGPADGELLLDIAEMVIRVGTQGGRSPGVDATRLPEALCEERGAFVTVLVDGQLNGCIGMIDPDEPLGVSIAQLAAQAAFDDPRLPALRRDQLGRTEIDISLLSPHHEVPARTRAELLAQLTPGHHGLIIASRGRRAVFLPSVWNQLPDPDDFVDHLFRKAGLSATPWPADLRADLFTAECFARRLAS